MGVQVRVLFPVPDRWVAPLAGATDHVIAPVRAEFRRTPLLIHLTRGGLWAETPLYGVSRWAVRSPRGYPARLPESAPPAR